MQQQGLLSTWAPASAQPQHSVLVVMKLSELLAQ